MRILDKLLLLTGMLLGISSCQPQHSKIADTATEATAAVPKSDKANSAYNKGDSVPSHLVCMVNDTFMGTPQLEVRYQNKTYYGCCQMCQERIPKDSVVRYAKDPHTLEPVDKADAYIVLIGNQGEVAYFKNEASYQQFKAGN